VIHAEDRRRRTRPRVVGVLLAVAAAVGLLGVPAGPTAPAEVRAAAPDLTITSTARYDVQPDKRRVRVTVDLTLVNHLKDTKTKRYYFDEAFLAILPQASGLKLSWSGKGTPSVRVTRTTKQFRMVRLDLAQRLYSGKTAKYRLRFDLKDPGGAPTRDLRVGDSLVSFPIWAYASDSTPGSSVSVVFPKGYDVRVEAGTLPDPVVRDDGRTVFSSGRLAKPLEFFAFLVADRPGALTTKPITVEVQGEPISLVLRSWPDDAPWAKRVGSLLRRALPALGALVERPWPHPPGMTIQEAVSRSTGGYAGLFDPSEQRVEIAYYAGDFVVLHEAAHGWFNGALLVDRWANEAFASYYAERAAKALKLKVHGEALTDKLRAHRIALNAWGPVGSETEAEEDYAYAASLALAEAIGQRAGDAGLRAVWDDAAERIGAYQPPTPTGPASITGGMAVSAPVASSSGAASATPEPASGPPDWRGLLDLLEAETGRSFDDLWRTWVARPDDLLLLDARAAARTRYDSAVAAAGDWQLPRPIRDAMRAWQFDEATMMLDAAEATLDARADLEIQANGAGLRLPTTLRATFEDADGFDDASAEAATELAAIDRYKAAVAARPVDPGPFVTLGLWNESPEARLVAAREAFAAGDLAGSAAASDDAAAAWSNAAAIGQGRALSLAALSGAVLLGVSMLIGAIRRRRRPTTLVAARSGD
jgi:hypothetical protein